MPDGSSRSPSWKRRSGRIDAVAVQEAPRDTELFAILDRELERQNTTLQLIASENFASRQVLEATGSVLTNKYSEGYPGKRYYGGNASIDEVEDRARTRCRELFGAEHANVQTHAGSQTNMDVSMAR